jgi:hypothetical protein
VTAAVNPKDYIPRLYRVFAGAPRPQKEEITPHRCCECAEVTERLAPHEAARVPDEDMLWLGDSLPLLGPAAFRYYLPRFLEFCLTQPPSMLDAVLNYNLAPTGDLDLGERNRFADFTPTEARVVLEFVEYRAKGDDTDLDRAYLDKAREFWATLAERREPQSDHRRDPQEKA